MHQQQLSSSRTLYSSSVSVTCPASIICGSTPHSTVPNSSSHFSNFLTIIITRFSYTPSRFPSSPPAFTRDDYFADHYILNSFRKSTNIHLCVVCTYTQRVHQRFPLCQPTGMHTKLLGGSELPTDSAGERKKRLT